MPASVVKRPVFHCRSMSSSEDEAQSPELGASSSKDPPPPLESGDPFTTPTKKCLRRNLSLRSPEKGIPPDTDLGASGSQDLPSDSDPESDESEDNSSRKKSRSYKRPPIEWENVVSFIKGDEATVDEDEMKSKVRAAAKKIMEDSRMIRLPSHTRPGDEGLWKEIRSYKTNRGKTLVRWFRCPMSYRFRCKCQIKIYDGEHYMALDVRGQHNADSHSGDKETSKHLKVKQIHALHTGVRCLYTISFMTTLCHLKNQNRSHCSEGTPCTSTLPHRGA